MVERAEGAPSDAFLVPGAGEFAHLHPGYDGSLHLTLPATLASDAIAKGWAVSHPWAGVRLAPGFVLVYGPRDAAELETATGTLDAPHAEPLITSHLERFGQRAELAVTWRRSER